MRALLLLVAVTSASAWAHSPQELLRLAQEGYKNPDGYEIKGQGSFRPPDSSWQVTFKLIITAAPAPLDTPQAPVYAALRVGGPLEFTKVGDVSDERPKALNYAPSVVGGWTRIAEDVESVEEIGTERLSLNGTAVDCRALEVEYKAPRRTRPNPRPSNIRSVRTNISC